MRECSQTFSFPYRSPSRELRGDVTCCVPCSGIFVSVSVFFRCVVVFIYLPSCAFIVLFLEIFLIYIGIVATPTSYDITHVSATAWRNDAQIFATRWRLIRSKLLFPPETLFPFAAGSNDRVPRENSEQSGCCKTTTWHRHRYTYVYVHICIYVQVEELPSRWLCIRLFV